MWQALDSATSLELEDSSVVLHSCFGRLDAATLELQKCVKELLAAYPDGERDDRGQTSTVKGSRGEAGSLGQADRLLTNLCAKLPRVEEGSAPGSMFTPRAAPKGGLVAFDAGVSMLAGADKLTSLLTADMPALRWGDAAGPAGAGPSPGPASGTARPAQAHGSALNGSNNQKLTPKLHGSAASAGAPEDSMRALQEYCHEVWAEAHSELREVCSATSCPLGVHRQLLQDAVELDSVPPRLPSREGPWLGALRVRAATQTRVRELLAAVIHTSKSVNEAWAVATHSLMHGLAQLDGLGLRMLAAADLPGPAGRSSGPWAPLAPEIFPERLAELRQEGERWLGELLQKRDESGCNPLHEKHSRKDFVALREAILPATYLQMVGQVLLYHAVLQLPAMAGLPGRAPDWTLRTLYARPLGEAVKAALIHALSEAPREATAPEGRGPEDCRPEDKTQRFPMPGRQQSGSQGQTTAAARNINAVSGQPGSEAALKQAMSAMARLAGVFREVAAFEAAFSDILSQPESAKFLIHGDCPPSKPAPLQPTGPIPPQTAAAYALILQEEVVRAVREVRAPLKTLVFGHLTSAVQACLCASDPPVDVPVASDAWPELPGEWGGAESAPHRIDAASQRVLLVVVRLQVGLGEYPADVQVVLLEVLLECLSILMDHLSTACKVLHDMPRDPLQRLLLFHSAACCLRRRLELLPCGRLAGLAADEHYLALVQQHGQCLVQSNELVSSLHRHIVQAHMDVVRITVLPCLDRTDWGAFRPEVMRGQSAGPAVRLWQLLVMRMLHGVVRISPADAAEWMVGQVLQDSLASLAHRYLQVCPSVQMLREFVADVVQLVATACVLCQALPMNAPPGATPVAPQAAQQGPRWLRLPHAVAVAVSSTAHALLTRAALLHIPAARLKMVAEAVRLLPPYPAADMPAAAALPPESPSSADMPALATASPLLQLPPRPPVPALAPVANPPRPQLAPPAALVPLGPTDGSSDTGGGGVSLRLAALPDINAHRASLPLAEASASGPSPAGPSAALVCAPDGGSAGPEERIETGEQRLALWTSWLPSDITAGLQAEVAGLQLGSERPVTRLLPLDDRLDESSPGGRAWRLCLEQLAEQASGEMVLLALARRCELHAAVGNEPEGFGKSSAIVRSMAQRMGLLRGEEL